jgi:HlyD family secretion protein
MMKKRKLWFITVGVLAILAVGFYVVTNGKSDKVSYRFDKVDRGDVIVSISATGTLNADTTVQVGSQVSGRIAKLYADFNSIVKRGQLLAQLDPTFLQAALDQVKAGVARSRASLNQAERDYKRTKDLFDKNLVSQADMDAALTNLESARAGLQQSEAAFEGADVNLRYATITSPISGVVISRNVDVGQTVAASLSAPTLFTIANDLRKMQVQASVDEADNGNVKVGQNVTFRVDSYPDDRFEGVVSQVRLAPVITQNVVNYTVIIDVANPEMKLMPGMTATVSIEVDKREDVLRAPIQAIRFTPPDEAKESSARSGEGTKTMREEASTDSVKGERAWTKHERPPGDSTRGERMRMWRQRSSSDSTRGERRWKSAATSVNRAKVWVMENGKPRAISISRGLMNTQYVEVVEGEVKEGDQVIIGVIGAQTATGSTGQNNPFQPRMPGGGGGGGGRRGF